MNSKDQCFAHSLTPLSSQPSSHLNKFRGSERKRNAVETEQLAMCSQSGLHQCWRTTNTIHTLQYSTVSYRTRTRQTKRAAKANIHIRSTICKHGIPLGIKSFERLFEPSSSLFAACQRQKCRAPNQIGHDDPLGIFSEAWTWSKLFGRTSPKVPQLTSQLSEGRVGVLTKIGRPSGSKQKVVLVQADVWGDKYG